MASNTRKDVELEESGLEGLSDCCDQGPWNFYWETQKNAVRSTTLPKRKVSSLSHMDILVWKNRGSLIKGAKATEELLGGWGRGEVK